MNFNHINVIVPNVRETARFFETNFDLKRIVTKGEETFIALVDDEDRVFSISNFDNLDDVSYPHWFHVGFMQESDAAVDAMHERLTKAGVSADEPSDQHDSYTFYVTSPGGFLVEIGCPHRVSGRKAPGN